MEQQLTAAPVGLHDYVYAPRPIRFLGVTATAGGWRVKRYGITVAGKGGVVPDGAAAIAWWAAEAALPLPAVTDEWYGVAILTMHLGLQGFWVLVDWWAHYEILMHQHFHAPADRPEALRNVSCEGLGPCVWELATQSHERGAWLRHVLANPVGPDLPAYLADGLDVTA